MDDALQIMQGRYVRSQVGWRQALGVHAGVRRGRPAWNRAAGLLVLVRWEGARLPVPALGPGATRAAQIVGVALADATTIGERSGITHAANTVYHYAVVAVSGGGVVGAIDPRQIRTRVYDGSGAVRGLLPATPGALSARLCPGRKVCVRWVYAPRGGQVLPTSFKVWRVTAPTAAFDFSAGAVVGSVTYVDGQTHYAWTDTARTVGDHVYYSVRAYASDGTLSLIPQTSGQAAESYDSVDLARCPNVHVNDVPAGISGLAVEA